MNAQIRSKFDRLQKIALALGVLGIVGVAAGCMQDLQQFFRAYLFAYMFWAGLAIGSLALTMLHNLTGGFWGLAIRRQLQAGIRTLPLVALLFIPIAVAIGTHPEGGGYWLYSWADPHIVAGDRVLEHKQSWLNPNMVLLRAAIYFAIWIGLGMAILKNAAAHDRTGDAKANSRTKLISGPGFLIYTLTMTFAAFDWCMSLDPHWFSTMYGVLFFVGQGLSVMAFSILFTAWVRNEDPYKNFAKPNLFHDLGTLMFAMVMLWAYTNFSQFLIIWSANLSEETPFYLRRLHHGWESVGLALVVFHFAVPFFLLLMRRIKRDASLVPFVGFLILAMRHVDLYWQIVPNYPGEGLAFHWMYLACTVAIGGIWMAAFLASMKKHPLTSPPQELALEAALAHH